MIGAYLESTVGRRRPPRAVLAVAGPVVDGEIEFTNIDWRISEGELVGTFEFESARLLNDFAAQALAAPVLPTENLRRIGPTLRGCDDAPLLVVGAGTGFGVSCLARSARGDIAMACEGGHATFAPGDEMDCDIAKIFRRNRGRVSIERILSGQGLFELYLAMAEIAGVPAQHRDERAMTAAAQTDDTLAQDTVTRFCGILGSVAGDIALTTGARGGVYISGGIAPKLIDTLMAGEFRRRFEDKGRLAGYMAEIPTALIVHPYAALVGAARALAWDPQ